MVNTDNYSTLGVMIGRYQIDDLHDGHIACIDEVSRRHRRVLILIGERDTPATDVLPLPAFIRQQMLMEKFPGVTVIPIMDHDSDEVWSQNVDKIVKLIAGPSGAILYSGRKGFIPHYSGRYPTVELEMNIDHISATERRAQIAQNPYANSSEFRAGMIYQMQHLIPRTYEAVDIAMLRMDAENNPEVLLVRKPLTKKWRFPGGHVEGTELTIDAARREMREETGLVFESTPKLVGEYLVNDWRVRDTDKAFYRTFLYAGWYAWGNALAQDDVEEARWFSVRGLTFSKTCHLVVPEHQDLLYDGLLGYLNSPAGLNDIQLATKPKS